MRKAFAPALVLAALFAFAACTTTQKTTTYKTLYSVEKAATAAYDAYLDLVIDGKVKSDDVPVVSQSYDRLQIAVTQAVNAAQFNWTNPPPNEVVGLLNEFLNAALKAKER